ncbi:MAG: lipopolysaccharide heptosyltransferase II [Gammaproteobacteria bacterium]|nr:lipopolysaccharide heptosyltransferase II [Gammaproteobacteria bacterium]
MSESERYLIVGPSWVGDMVMAQSLFMLLKQRDPDCRIDVVAPPWSVPVLARMRQVHDAMPLDVAHGELGFFKRRRLGRELRERGYTRAIVLPRSAKSALVPFYARIPRRTGFRTEMRFGLLNDLRRLDRDTLDQTVKRFMALGLQPDEALPDPLQPELQSDRDNLAALRERFGLQDNAVALMPGAAYGPAKCWPLAYYGELAKTLTARGRQVWVVGGDAEREAGEQIRAAGGDNVLNLCGETRLEDSVDLFSFASVAVTNDSGLMHVAAAAGTRVIAIYGSSSPDYTPPLTNRAEILYLGLDCSPCFERECPLGHLNCLRDIKPAMVLEQVARAH